MPSTTTGERLRGYMAPNTPALFHFDNSYARLPEIFWRRVAPTPVKAPRLLSFNLELAAELRLDAAVLSGDLGAAIFSGNPLPDGAASIAMAYAGHQFGQFVPQLGDGRAILLGEVVDRHGRHRDIQLKGAGRTPFSRGGDGRAALGPVLREYLVSEAMHALGVPTTRALAAVATGEGVWRDLPLPGAILTRVATSHLRVGTFQYFAARGDTAAVRQLADYAITRHDPDLAHAEQPYLGLLEAVAERQAALVAHWMQVGFIHGVMNTDNSSISGETIDYGPCAFLDDYNPAQVFSAIDRHGRYAFANQPHIAQWNLARLAETLLPLIDPVDDERAVELASAVIEAFPVRFERHWLQRMRGKLGLAASVQSGDLALVQAFLDLLHAGSVDYTLAFRDLCAAAENPDALVQARERLSALQQPRFDAWVARWQDRLAADAQSPAERAVGMRRSNPALIPRNHRVQDALTAAIEHDDLAPFQRLLAVLRNPWDETTGALAYMQPPQPSERVLQTFCGT